MVSFPSRNLRIVMVNSPPILNSPPIAPNGTRIASTWSNSKGMDLSHRLDRAATTAQIVKVLDYQKRHKLTLTATVNQPKLTQWRKTEDEHRALLESGQGSMRRNNSVMHPNLEKALAIWCTQALEQNTTIITDVLRLKGQQLADKLEIRDFAFSNGWLQGFKIRYSRDSCSSEKVDAKTREEERKRVVDLTNKYDPSDIFNMDETGLFYAMRPSTGLARNGRNGVKMNKTRITFAFTVNANGSERLPPFIIGSTAKPRSFNKKPPSYYNHYYRSNKKAWMTGELYVEWLKARDLELRSKGRKVQLWLDVFSGHTRDVDSFTNIEVHYFALNMT
ncbi:BZ3500_MvSof-1268-A1-R1_Chr9g10401 [Microbotryum saponariae]|uniref:BZ3500_MvSof-1268-A1-R1_Chr9g10401 protein n=1 Tax=Microbotryum saponariae TaxID=289078 RepID=A0A2X0K8J8_9BASI|nr:BZ3501_MvSof-1269-A2-R1_Chr9g10151 [Microbotryum saponariae]SDA00031.1 BZ3500_MvSof-1268-A1-R1_Chr9g10401 [Microbotryum saponariae]